MKRINLTGLLMCFCIAVILSASCEGGSEGGGGGSSLKPQVPSGVSATEGVHTNSVNVSWSAAEGAEYYVVYKSIDDRNQFRVIATDIRGLSYTDDKVTPNRIYFYRVAAGCGDAWSEPSIDARGFAHTGKPMKPDKVIASSDTIGSITVRWSSVLRTNYSFRVMRSDSAEGLYSEIAKDLPYNQAEYKDELSLTRDKKYYYRVIVVSAAEGEGESDPGQTEIPGVALQDTPAAPGNFVVSNGTFKNKVTLSWNGAALASTYSVYRAPDNGGTAGTYERIGQNIILDSTGVGFFEDTTATVDQPYLYTVCGVSSGGEGVRTAETIGLMSSGGTEQATTPVNVAATDGDFGSVTVTWDLVVGAHSYNIYRSDSINGTYSRLNTADITTNSFTDNSTELTSDLTAFKHFFYYVTAMNGSESRASTPDEGYAKPLIADVPVIQSVSTNLNTAKIVITFGTSARGVSYNLYRAEAADGTYNTLASGLKTTGASITYEDLYPSISVGKPYYYRVSAVNISGESERSAAVSGNTVMKIPANVTITKTARYVRLIKWDAVEGSTAYEIDHKVGTGSWTTVTVTATESSFADLKNSVTHYFRVRAVNGITKSSNSSEVSDFVVWLE